MEGLWADWELGTGEVGERRQWERGVKQRPGELPRKAKPWYLRPVGRDVARAGAGCLRMFHMISSGQAAGKQRVRPGRRDLEPGWGCSRYRLSRKGRIESALFLTGRGASGTAHWRCPRDARLQTSGCEREGPLPSQPGLPTRPSRPSLSQRALAPC